MNDSPNPTHNIDDPMADMASKLADASRAGNGLAWTGAVLALVWWGVAGYALFEVNQINPFANHPSGLFAAAIGFAILPGLILLFAGFMARQNKRANEANILLLQASTRLLSPARTATDEMQTLAEATRYSTAAINQTSSMALNSLKETSDAMATERLRAESVGYAMADNARDLTLRLSEERIALETISKSLSEQVTIMGTALPRQAEAMKQATLIASQDVAKADSVFSARIQQMQETSSTLATRLMELDTIARDAATRTETLQTTISGIEDRLNKSHKTVEMAERASAMAVEAATQTGNALKDAVSAALDSARDANREISERTLLIQETSRQAMAELSQTGAKAASAAARVQEQSLGITAESPAPTPAQPSALADEQVPQQDDAPLVRARKSPSITEVTLKSPTKRPLRTRRVYNDEIDPVAETRPEASDTDLFDVDMPPYARAEPTAPAPTQPKITSSKPAPDLDSIFEADNEQLAPAATPPLELGSEGSALLLNHPYGSPAPTSNDAPSDQPTEWRDIIADIGDEQALQPSGRREATAEELISRLSNSGIPLPTAFRARDKKKIAVAARKDHEARRRAIRSVAGVEVDRVAVRLNKDESLKKLAQRFVSAEEKEALKALKDTGGSGRHASPRLSAYLLVDTALDPTLRS